MEVYDLEWRLSWVHIMSIKAINIKAIIMKLKSHWGLGVQNGAVTDPTNEWKLVESSVIINQFTYGVRLHIHRGRERVRIRTE